MLRLEKGPALCLALFPLPDIPALDMTNLGDFLQEVLLFSFFLSRLES